MLAESPLSLIEFPHDFGVLSTSSLPTSTTDSQSLVDNTVRQLQQSPTIELQLLAMDLNVPHHFSSFRRPWRYLQEFFPPPRI